MAVTIDNLFYMTNSVVALAFVVGIYLILASCCIGMYGSKIMKEKIWRKKSRCMQYRILMHLQGA